VIIICRFHLTLQERHNQLHSPSLPTLSLTSFHAVRQTVHNAIVAEFGNPHLSQDFSAETLEDGVTGQEPTEEARPAGIELDEFPWATLGIGEVDMVGPIDPSE
jgi:hypothetical protein